MPDHFDLLAPLYDRAIRSYNPNQLIRLANLPSEGRLLDAGGGTGRIGFTLRAYIPQVVIADLSIGMLRQAAVKDGLQTVCSQSEKLPFPDSSFDRIIIVDAMHHVFDARLTARELWRVLTTGGRLVIEEPDIRSPAVKIIALLEKMALMRSKFVAPQEMANYFQFPQSKVLIESQGNTIWLIIDKLAD